MQEINQQKELVSQPPKKKMDRQTKLILFLGLLIVGPIPLGFIVQILEAPEKPGSPGLMILPIVLFGLVFWGGIGYLVLRVVRLLTKRNDK